VTPTVIGNDVWICDGAVILPGVKVGTGAVVGANAVVVRNVAPYEVVGGVPARRLKI
jgi:acetyltransferase-like isoleucine patch superfamily enzyme